MRSCEVKECFMNVSIITKEDDCKCALWMLVLLLKKMTVSTPVKNVTSPELSVLFLSCCAYCISPIINTGTVQVQQLFLCLFFVLCGHWKNINWPLKVLEFCLLKPAGILPKGIFTSYSPSNLRLFWPLNDFSSSTHCQFWKLSMKHSN